MPRSSPTSAAEAPGGLLVAASLGVVAGTAAGNFALVPPAVGAVLVLLALAAAACGARRHPSGMAWWAIAGLLGGIAACAFAARRPVGVPADEALPARFVARVRDGWTDTGRGWRSRLSLHSVDAAGVAVRAPGDVAATVWGNADPTSLPAPGSLVEGSGELRWAGRTVLERPTMGIKTALLLEQTRPPRGIDMIRERGVQLLRRTAGTKEDRQRAAGLAAALCLGRTEGLAREEVSLLRRSGLAHILAVSGLNVGMVAAMAWALLVVAGVPPYWRRWALVVVVIAFALVAGANPPVRRAAAGAAAYLVARQFGRPLAALPTVWGVVAALLLAEPSAAMQPSFQLSALITLALVRWSGPLAGRLGLLPRAVAGALAVVVSAQAAALPLVGVLFGTVPVLGLLANLLASPLSFALLATGLVALLLAPFGLGGPVLAALAVQQDLLDALGRLGGGVVWPFPPVPAWLVVGAAVLGLAAVTPWRRAAVPALVVVATALAWPHLPARRAAPFEAQMLAVGDGMAVLLQTPRSALLVDAGRWPGEALRELARARVRRLDALIVTHPDEDHTGGAAAVLETIKVAALVYPAGAAERVELEPLRQLARRRAVAEVAVAAGGELTAGDVAVRVLWPPTAWAGGDNDASLVAVLIAGPVRLLVCGDIEGPGERALVAGGADLRADLLQLGHHGSRTSSSRAFLAAVAPRVALAASGTRPRYQYPHPEVRRRARGVGALVLAQTSGLAAVRWSGAGETVTVDTREPVTVRLRGRQ
ncbi:MAG: internalization-related competence protein ComEC/Rec2 [Acidobacteria bacterium]|nr:internalization-related competence protein ComEC/Rec2 [Acidobacteriota bacterium]